MTLSLGFSPCPNDTFIFDALIHGKIDTEGLSFEVCYEDVETLNQKAFKGELDITKLSFHAFAYVLEQYALLHAGSALGFGVGPLLISKLPVFGYQLPVTSYQQPATDNKKQIADNRQPTTEKIGIPGKYTTANFLLSLAFPEAQNKQEIIFSGIESALLNDEIDLGLIIHENRFTYAQKGLHKVIDLGEWWEQETGAAIPLGGIVIRRSLPEDVQQKVNRVLRSSVEYAFANPESCMDFVRAHAQEMDEAVMKQHIQLYVNQYSIDLGEEGRKAIEILFAKAHENQLIPKSNQTIFTNKI